jgi:NADH:ubiquinone oxidoreductase subunit
MRRFLTQFFTWWNGQTLGTRFHTWRFGELVGRDGFGNVYYRTAGGRIDPALGFERRWVIYNGPSEGSMTPPGWYGWLHHITDEPPTVGHYRPREWERPYVPNMTGTPFAYHPPGSLQGEAIRPPATGDYQAWTPEG